MAVHVLIRITVVVLSLAGVRTPASAQQGSSVVGIVVDSTTGTPVVGAIVAVSDVQVETDDDGRFILEGVRGPEVRIMVRAIGYSSQVRRVRLSASMIEVRIRLTRQQIRLEDLEVTADEAAELMRTAQSTVRMNAEEIRRERGQTLGETLKEMPGVAIIQYGPSIAKPVVRGLHSHRVITMQDGVRQEGQQWGGEHAPEVDIFAANEIEVVRGTANTLYGSDALGGVVRIDPAPLPTHDGVAGEAVLNTFSNNLQAAGSIMLETGGVRLPLLGRTGVRVRGSLRRAGDARAPTVNTRNTGFAELNGSATIGIDRPWGRSEFTASRFDTDLGLFIGAHVGNVDDLQRAIERGPFETDFSYEIDAPRQEVTHDKLSWKSLLHTSPADLEIVLAYQKNHRREYDNHGPVAERGIPAFALKLFTYSADVRARHGANGPLRGTLGASFLHQANISEGKSFLIPQYWLHTWAVYANEEIEFGHLRLSAGARYDWRWQRVFEFRIGGQDFPAERKTYADVAGSLGWSYEFADDWTLSGTVGRAWRAPNVNERFSLGVHHGTAQYEIGDASLGVERAFNMDLTVRHGGTRVAFEASGYRNLVSDYIYLHPRDPVLTIRGAFPAYEYRQTDAVLHGVDLAAHWWPSDHVTFELGGSVVRGTNQLRDEPLYDLPADRVTVSGRLTGDRGRTVWNPYIELGVVGVRKQDQVPSVTVYALPTNGYAVLNAELGVDRVWLGGTSLEVSLAVRNLLNTSYRDYLSRYKLFIDDPGRDVVLRARLPFGPAR